MRVSAPKKNIDPNFNRGIIKNWPKPAVKDPGFNRPHFTPTGHGSLLPSADKECVDPQFRRTTFGQPACSKPLPPMKGDHVIDPGFNRTLLGSQDCFVPSPQASELLRGPKNDVDPQFHRNLFDQLGW